jgi:hypothetical protein
MKKNFGPMRRVRKGPVRGLVRAHDQPWPPYVDANMSRPVKPKSKLPTKLLSELAHLFGVESAHAKTLPEADRLATISEELYRSASRHRR